MWNLRRKSELIHLSYTQRKMATVGVESCVSVGKSMCIAETAFAVVQH
jgi:hypothetical protein